MTSTSNHLVECVSHGRCCGVVVDCVRRIQCMNPSHTVDHITNSERKDAKKASSELDKEGPQAGVCMGHSCRRQLQVRDFLGPGLP